MSWEAFAAAAIAYAAQWAKASNIDNRIVVIASGLIGIALYAVKVHPSPPFDQWIVNAIMWAMAVIGGASAAGHLGLAPATKTAP